jgi:hypothetical protein
MGEDVEGRVILFYPATTSLTIGGMHTDIERLLAGERKSELRWRDSRARKGTGPVIGDEDRGRS